MSALSTGQSHILVVNIALKACTQLSNVKGETDKLPREVQAEIKIRGCGGRPNITCERQSAEGMEEKKEGAERERIDRIRDQEVENRQGPRHVEMVKIKEMLKQRGLVLHEIPADGNCLYSALSHQLSTRSLDQSTEKLRQQTSEYMRSHRDDFLPFLTHPDSGDALTDEEFEQYCDKTASSPVWGGQVELRALSEVLQLPIEVLQAEAEPMVIGDCTQDKPLTLVYHRHIFRLGEHYNSVMAPPLPAEGDKEEDLHT
ncbi:hypothetical protein RRG08_028209 [Elysia crispata]|uniref:ubiquitinyl hydrolase 1 n=1 Tax=Elysia crispata TaxID=231223 RepID=A0AAE0YBE2_9GAST|nr:hypothetical protein RRG08_028209 [Elysia crispata]